MNSCTETSNPWDKSVYYSLSDDEDDDKLIYNNNGEKDSKSHLKLNLCNHDLEFIDDYTNVKTCDLSATQINMMIDDFKTDISDEQSDEEDPFSEYEFQNFLTRSQLNKVSLDKIYSQANYVQDQHSIEGTFHSLVNGVAHATYSVGKIIINAYYEFKKFIWPPAWVLEKYECGIKNIFKKLNELNQFYKNSPENELKELIQPIFDSIQQNQFQTAHSDFLLGLRSALSSEVYKSELKKYMQGQQDYDPLVLILLDLCRIRFEEGSFYDILNTLMSNLGIEGIDKLHKKDFDIIEKVDSDLKISFFEVNLKKLLGHINVNFDPHLQGNIPYINDILDMGKKKVRLIRMGTPTVEGYMQKAQIIEEFRGYLQHCVADHKIHLYISLQNDKMKSVFNGDAGGDESGRNQIIKDQQNEFSKNFFTVVLAHDSSFYKQISSDGKVRDIQYAGAFFDEFKRELFGKDTGFYFPEAWKKDSIFKEKINNLLYFVLKTYFDGKAELKRQEKQDFIQIFYAALSLFLIDYSQADNVNITCKDGIDRAGMLNSLLLKLVMTIEGHVDTPESQRKHKVLTHSAAFWTKSQAIISKSSGDISNGRRERLLSADAKMNETRGSFKEKVPGNTIQQFMAAAVA